MTHRPPVLQRGTTPLLISLPHCGTELPDDIARHMVPRAKAVEDTDWLMAPLYAFAREMGAGLLIPAYSRYVIDLNRPPDNAPMYPGANNTELCPTRFFTGEDIYLPGLAPDAAEVERRRALYWQPYHDLLHNELNRLKAQHGHAVLFDGHSIRSVLPWLFEGQLPDLNLGTVTGTSCATSLRDALGDVLASQQHFTQVVDGRFKGGYITRQHGQPAQGIHAVQLEMCWRCYLDESVTPTRETQLQPEHIAQIQPVLQALVQVMRDWRPQAAQP